MNEKFALLAKNQNLILGLTFSFSAVAGTAVGYFVAKKRLELRYEELSKREIAEAKQFYSVLNKRDDFETPASAVESLGLTEAAEALMKYQGKDKISKARSLENDPVYIAGKALKYGDKIEDGDTVSVEVHEAMRVETDSTLVEVTRNVFTDSQPADDNFDYDEEVKSRTPDAPYVITHDEYMEAEPEYNQVILTYYIGDDVLTDDKDQPIDETDATVGDDNLLRFGHGSKDNKIVYVRNDRLDLDFEILQSHGSYVEEVLGFIEHSDHRSKIRRFRGDDE